MPMGISWSREHMHTHNPSAYSFLHFLYEFFEVLWSDSSDRLAWHNNIFMHWIGAYKLLVSVLILWEEWGKSNLEHIICFRNVPLDFYYICGGNLPITGGTSEINSCAFRNGMPISSWTYLLFWYLLFLCLNDAQVSFTFSSAIVFFS